MKAGESFDYHGVIMYQLVNNKFTDIKVSYLSFSRTDLDGNTIELGHPALEEGTPWQSGHPSSTWRASRTAGSSTSTASWSPT